MLRSEQERKARSRLGECLLKEGVVTENQLQYALQLQQESPRKRRLGDILLELGYVTKRQLRDISRKYQHRMPLGSILLSNGLVTEEQLEQALEIQKTKRILLGQSLLEQGVVSEEQIAMALSQQMDYPYILPNKRIVDRTLLAQFSESFLRRQAVLPIARNQDTITLLVSNPLHPELHEVLKGHQNSFELAIGPRTMILKVLQEIFEERTLLGPPTRSAAEEESPGTRFVRYDLDKSHAGQGPSAQVIDVVNYILSKAIKERASDIHIESLYNRLRIRYRIDGRLIFQTDLPKSLADAVTRRIKVLAHINVTDSADTQDGHIYVTLDGNDVDMRVSATNTVLGPSITIRILTKELGLRDLDDLGMLPRVLHNLQELLDRPSGLILFSGPTGSGKTTSLYSCLNYLNKDDIKICTIESPVEYSIEGVAQYQLKGDSGTPVSEVVKAMLHHDPDVIVLGEINNETSAIAAVEAALTGHKVFSTIHSDDAIGAVQRLIGLGLRTYLLSSTGIAASAQRLVRRICPQCKEVVVPSAEMFRQFRTRDLDADRWEFYRGKGCEHCGQSGYRGRTGVFELLTVSDEIRNGFLQTWNSAAIRRLAQSQRRYISLRQAGFIMALLGRTTLEETLAILSYSEKETYESMELTEADIEYWMETDPKKMGRTMSPGTPETASPVSLPTA